MIFDPNQPFVDKAQRLTSWGHWFTFFNILLALVISYGYISTDEGPTTLLGYAYLVTNWLGHTAFITFICFVLTIFPLSMIFPYPRHIRGMAAILATGGMILLSIDAYSYSRLGYHISGASFEQVFTLLTQTWNNHPFRSFMWVFSISSVILVFELYISNFTWKRVGQLKQKAFGQQFAIIFLMAFISSHLIHIWADATFNYDVAKQNNMFPFSYPATAKTLLAKNGLLDEQARESYKANQLTVRRNLDYYPSRQPLQCDVNDLNRDLHILLTGQTLGKNEIEQLQDQDYTLFNKHYVPTNEQDAVFNLLYGLPAVYKNSVLANQQKPTWYTLAQRHQLGIEIEYNEQLVGYGFIGGNKPTTTDSRRISVRQIDNSRLASYLEGLQQTDVIIVGKTPASDSAITKAPLLVKWRNPLRYRGQVTQNLDLNATLVESWLNCKPEANPSADPDIYGKNILRKRPKVLAANYTDGTIVFIHKDKITLLNEQGNSQKLSATNGYILSQETDIPMLIDTIKLLKQYSK